MGATCRSCAMQFGEYKIIQTDWYQCLQCASNNHWKPSEINIIKLKPQQKYLQYVIFM